MSSKIKKILITPNFFIRQRFHKFSFESNSVAHALHTFNRHILSSRNKYAGTKLGCTRVTCRMSHPLFVYGPKYFETFKKKTQTRPFRL